MDKTGDHLVQIYWIMGRSKNSRNRVFKSDIDTGRLYTEPADPAKAGDPSLIIYNAMKIAGRDHIASNGNQTDIIADSPLVWEFITAPLRNITYEPDAPNYTQRITAASSPGAQGVHKVQMSILRKSVFGDTCDRSLYMYIPQPGFGHCITTYAGDGDPLPPFRGDPLLMPLRGSMENIANEYWCALSLENRVSLAVKFIPVNGEKSDIFIVNKY